MTLALGFSLSLGGCAERGQLTLRWQSPPTGPVKGYLIERRGGPSESYRRIASVRAPATAYTDRGLVLGDRYCYRVLAFAEGGESAPTADVCGVARPRSGSRAVSP